MSAAVEKKRILTADNLSRHTLLPFGNKDKLNLFSISSGGRA
jgi:hypothetical protein